MLQWLIEYKDLITLFFAFVVTVSTLVYAFLTASLVKETAHMRRVQTEPKLFVYFQPLEEVVNFGHLYIKNIGFGPAYDISISITPESSTEGSIKLLDDFLKVKAFDKGLNYLGPNQTLRSGFTSMVKGYEEKIKSVLNVTLTYTGADKKIKKEAFRIDFSELEGYGTLGKPHLYSIAQSLEKIQKDIHHIVTGFYKPKIYVFNHEDRVRELQEYESWRNDITKGSE